MASVEKYINRGTTKYLTVSVALNLISAFLCKIVMLINDAIITILPPQSKIVEIEVITKIGFSNKFQNLESL